MSAPDSPRWGLLSGHGRVLVAVTRNPQARVRELSDEAGITQRTAQSILADLESAGYITRRRAGRQTAYTVHLDQPFRHRAHAGLRVGPLLLCLAAVPAEPPTPAVPGQLGEGLVSAFLRGVEEVTGP